MQFQCLGLLDKRPRWGLTWKGRLVFIGCILFILTIVVFGLSPFMAKNAPVGRGVLVVEGWMPAHAIQEICRLYQKGGYDKIITIGCKFNIPNPKYSKDNYADLGKDIILEFDSNIDVISVPGPKADFNRTWHSIKAFKNWLDSDESGISTCDIATMGLHARRSYLCFSNILKDEYEYGIICIDNPAYPTHSWWKSSEGLDDMVEEVVGLGLFVLWSPFMESI